MEKSDSTTEPQDCKQGQTPIGIEQIKNYKNIVKQVEQNQQPKNKTNGKD